MLRSSRNARLFDKRNRLLYGQVKNVHGKLHFKLNFNVSVTVRKLSDFQIVAIRIM